MRAGTIRLFLGIVVRICAVLYFIPTLLEALLIRVGHPFVATVFVANLAGSVLIALSRRGWGIVLYLTLAAIQAAALYLKTPVQMLLFTGDLIPTALFAAIAFSELPSHKERGYSANER